MNGCIETNPGRRVLPEDSISADGSPLPTAERVLLYLMLHKPVQVVSTVSDPEGRDTVTSILPETYRGIRLYPVGRLDYFSEGLIILTNDGDFANSIMHPRFHLPKVYEVTIRGYIPAETVQRMRDGTKLDDGTVLPPVEIRETKRGPNTLLSMTLFQGLNRQIRKMCEQERLTILRLVRISEGPLLLGDLPAGAVRPLSTAEIAALKKACQQGEHSSSKAAQKSRPGHRETKDEASPTRFHQNRGQRSRKGDSFEPRPQNRQISTPGKRPPHSGGSSLPPEKTV